MSRVAIRCIASTRTGMGHIVRQTHLGNVLRDRGMEVNYFIPDYPPARDILTKSRFTTEITANDVLVPEAVLPAYNLIVLDIRDTSRDAIQKLNIHGARIISFEDLGSGRNHVDLLVDSNLDPALRTQIRRGIQPLFGLEYSVLNPDFAEIHNLDRTFDSKWNRVLITFGGTDPKGITLRVIELLINKRPDLKLTAVMGPGFKDQRVLEQLTSNRSNVTLLSHVSNMAEILATHEAVICSGGVTLHEAMASGTPAFVINQVLHQEDKARVVERLGAAVNLGLAENLNGEKLLAALSRDEKALESMSQAGKSVVDGRGIYRVADAIEMLTRQ